MTITANELVALHAERIGEGTICDFLASLGDRPASGFRHDAEANRIVQLNDNPVGSQPAEIELSGEMLEAMRTMIGQLAAD